MITKLYNWMMEKAAEPKGERWLGILSFAEASFFPIPVDIMLLPMILAQRARAWRLAFITSATSTAGAVAGYFIGMLLFETVGRSILAFYGYEAQFESFKDSFAEYGVLAVLIGALTPIPFKVVTIASGAVGFALLPFVISCALARSFRYYAEAVLLWYFGPPIQAFVEKRLPLLFTLFIILVVGGFVAIKFL